MAGLHQLRIADTGPKHYGSDGLAGFGARGSRNAGNSDTRLHTMLFQQTLQHRADRFLRDHAEIFDGCGGNAQKPFFPRDAIGHQPTGKPAGRARHGSQRRRDASAGTGLGGSHPPTALKQLLSNAMDIRCDFWQFHHDSSQSPAKDDRRSGVVLFVGNGDQDASNALCLGGAFCIAFQGKHWRPKCVVEHGDLPQTA